MNFLVTAGNTQTPIDEVRCITNIFSGRTGGRIAVTAWERGHHVTLATSHPEVLYEWKNDSSLWKRWEIRPYRTFDELNALMESLITTRPFDVIIHAAAVSDYALQGIYAPDAGSRFDRISQTWEGGRLHDVHQGKVKSSHSEVWLRLTPTVKLVDRIRKDWGFQGILVKFKLEVQVTEEELTRIAERSRLQSSADLMVANTLEGKESWALVGNGNYQRVERAILAEHLLERVEALHR